VVGGSVLLLASLAAGVLIRVNKNRLAPGSEMFLEETSNELASAAISVEGGELAATVAQV